MDCPFKMTSKRCFITLYFSVFVKSYFPDLTLKKFVVFGGDFTVIHKRFQMDSPVECKSKKVLTLFLKCICESYFCDLTL